MIMPLYSQRRCPYKTRDTTLLALKITKWLRSDEGNARLLSFIMVLCNKKRQPSLGPLLSCSSQSFSIAYN
jgi:hypothetical protein